VTGLPCQYLGLPLRLGRLRREDEQILIDRVAGKLPNWKGKLLNKAGRLALVQSVQSAVVTYHLTSFHLSKWALKKIDQICRRFLWHGFDNVWHSHDVVHWKRVARPKQLGGLDIIDLERFNTALRLRWPWLQWTNSGKPWHMAATSNNKVRDGTFSSLHCDTIGRRQEDQLLA
jgi:hypothetical protein